MDSTRPSKCSKNTSLFNGGQQSTYDPHVSNPTAAKQRGNGAPEPEQTSQNGKQVLAGVDLASLPEVVSSKTIQDILDAADEVPITETVTVKNMKHIVAQFDSRIKKNTEFRLKFPDEPERFLDSEVDLDDELERLKAVALSPELLSQFAQHGGIELLLPLLSHPNTDLAGSAIAVLVDITSPEVVMELEDFEGFVCQIVIAGWPSFLGDLLTQVDEKQSDEDYRIISNGLQVAENLIEANPPYIAGVLTTESSKFVPWLLRRVRAVPQHPDPPVCYNRCFAAELLAIILQNSSQCRKRLGNRSGLDGVEKLLRCLAVYRKRNPTSADEEEFVANVVDALTALLQEADNRTAFGAVMGLDLMIRFMRDRMTVYPYALRLVACALMDSKENCNVFIDRLGLKSLFGIFMRRGVRSKPGSRGEREEDEHCIEIILHLCRQTSGTALARLLNKFTENKCEKLERLLELHQVYAERVQSAESSNGRRTTSKELSDQLDVATEDLDYLAQCEAGLFTLQCVDNILVRLTNMGNAFVSQRIHCLLDIKGVPIQQVYSVLTDYINRSSPNASEREELGAHLKRFTEATECADV